MYSLERQAGPAPYLTQYLKYIQAFQNTASFAFCLF